MGQGPEAEATCLFCGYWCSHFPSGGSGGSFCHLSRENGRPPQKGILHCEAGRPFFSRKGGQKTTLEWIGSVVQTQKVTQVRLEERPIPTALAIRTKNRALDIMIQHLDQGFPALWFSATFGVSKKGLPTTFGVSKRSSRPFSPRQSVQGKAYLSQWHLEEQGEVSVAIASHFGQPPAVR